MARSYLRLASVVKKGYLRTAFRSRLCLVVYSMLKARFIKRIAFYWTNCTSWQKQLSFGANKTFRLVQLSKGVMGKLQGLLSILPNMLAAGLENCCYRGNIPGEQTGGVRGMRETYRVRFWLWTIRVAKHNN